MQLQPNTLRAKIQSHRKLAARFNIVRGCTVGRVAGQGGWVSFALGTGARGWRRARTSVSCRFDDEALGSYLRSRGTSVGIRDVGTSLCVAVIAVIVVRRRVRR